VAKAPKSDSTRKPPLPSDSHAEIDEWMQGVMPGLRPLVEHLDEMIRDGLPRPQQYALKWKKAYYGVPDRVKVRALEELERAELAAWIEQAGRTAGWK
jgi:hypothetical protein